MYVNRCLPHTNRIMNIVIVLFSKFYNNVGTIIYYYNICIYLFVRFSKFYNNYHRRTSSILFKADHCIYISMKLDMNYFF